MKVHDDHLYHGAALIQIAEDPRFTAINSLRVNGQVIASTYKINNDSAVYLKYAVEEKEPYGEYVFTFRSEQIDLIRAVAEIHERVIVALVCVEAREICALSADQLAEMIAERQRAFGGVEQQYTVLVTAPAGKGLRAYMNKPGTRGQHLKERVVARKAFPEKVFA